MRRRGFSVTANSAAGWSSAEQREQRAVSLSGEEQQMIRPLLVLSVIALGADALLNNGGYTQTAWHKLQEVKIEATKDKPPAQPERRS